MTVAIPEAAGAAESTAARVYRPRHARPSAGRTPRQPRRSPATTTTARTRSRPRGNPATATTTTLSTGAGGAGGRGGNQDQDRDRDPDRSTGGGGIPGHGSYHRIVIAEFIATVMIIGASPFLIPRTSKSATPEEVAKAAAKGADPLSLAGPLVRLTATCVVFFVLALLSSGRRSGKIAAAFGALVMLGALINATDMWTALGQVFSGKQPFTPDTGFGAEVAQTAKNAVG